MPSRQMNRARGDRVPCEGCGDMVLKFWMSQLVTIDDRQISVCTTKCHKILQNLSLIVQLDQSA